MSATIELSDLRICGRCHHAYEIGYVKSLHRYADSDVFLTPCCNVEVDDRRFTAMPSVLRLSDVYPTGTRYRIEGNSLIVLGEDIYGSQRIVPIAARRSGGG